MKQYEFHSTLPPERVFARLSARTKKGKYIGGWQEAETFFSCRKEEHIQLTYSGRWLLLSWGFLTVIQPVFFQKRRKAILNFIQENLLE